MRSRPISEEAAHEIYDALIEHAGAYKPEDGERDSGRDSFVRYATEGTWREYRFQGSLGFGGKARFYGENFYVDCYPEDITPKRQDAIEATNKALTEIFKRHYGAS
jgi:hypothetical protein